MLQNVYHDVCIVCRVNHFIIAFLYSFFSGSAFADVPRFAYVANPYDYTISAFYIDETGRMFPNGMVFTRDKFPSAVITHPNGKFLFSATRTNDTAPIYNIDPITGWLSETADSHFDTRLRSPFYYFFHPSGKFLYMAGRGGGVAGLSVDEKTGSVNYVPGSPFPSGERTRCLTVHPSGEFLYATNAYSNNISAYRIDQKTGSLKQLKNSPFPAGEEGPFDDTFAKLPDVLENKGGLPYFIAAHPNGDFVYVTNWAAASISIFRVDKKTGNLSLVGRPRETGLTPYAVAVHPSGKYLMASTWGSNDVWVYDINQNTGEIDHVKGSPFPTYGVKPVDIAFNKEGTLAYVANIGSNNVSIFDVDVASGKMALKDFGMARSGAIDVTLTSQTGAVKIMSDHAIFSDTKSGNLQVYKVDPNSGEFEFRSATKTGGKTGAIAVDPLNRFVFVTNTDANTVSAYRMVRETGALIEVEGSPYQVGKSPDDIKVDANGWYLYVLNKQSRDMSVFLIHVKTGQLAEVQGSPVALTKTPANLEVDPTSRFVYVNSNGENSISAFRFRTAITPSVFEIIDFGSPYSFNSNPASLAIDPTGRFAMILEAEKSMLEMRFVHVGTGALETIRNASAFKFKGEGAVEARFHPNGRFAYVLNAKSRSINQLSVERLWGKLQETAEPVTLKEQPRFITIDPSGQYMYVSLVGKDFLLKYKIDKDTGLLTEDGKIKLSFVPDALVISRTFGL